MIMGNLSNSLKVRNYIVRIAHTLDIDSFGVFINGSREIFELSTAHEFGRHAESWKQDVQLIIGPSIQMRAGDKVIARLCESGDSKELRGLTRGCCN